MRHGLRFLMLLFIMVFLPIFGEAQNQVDFAVLDVKYEGNFDKVSVFVNTVASGEVVKGQIISIRLAGDASYQITLQRGDMAETKTVYLAKNLRRQLVFFGPNLP
ncbi:MAG: hypothetical protein LBC99_05620 [Spirochaetota bacterium]|nr:hypothetical protein [Spirochaetota bacterium]